jgi:hydrogenase maturation protein HypF
MAQQRQRLVVRGIVQGVGFRPFVYRLARELALTGWVRNDGHGVTLEVQGRPEVLAGLPHRLRAEAPPLARIEQVSSESIPLCAVAEAGFSILESRKGGCEAAIGPDTCVCQSCLTELFTPADRRYRYAFINCTDCGPRYTLVKRLPYDRAQTSMAKFVQCPQCLEEYTDPGHRRFHAEPNACPDCGPRLDVRDASGRPVAGDAVVETLARLMRGEIVAIKGIGGFHLACDARNADAVATLRERKNREGKPLAVMVAGPASLQGLAEAGEDELALLSTPERPIVLLPKAAGADARLTGVAPGVMQLGVLLPYTPLHYLLFHEAAGRPEGIDWLGAPQDLVLVMTSANPHGEPLVIDNADALDGLRGIADAYLLHDREIVTRCDDSVLRPLSGAEAQFIRRSRGFTPRAVWLAQDGPAVLSLGAYFKNTFCVMRGRQAFLSQHIGDLDRPSVCVALQEATSHLLRLLEVSPALIAHDLHPDFFSSRLASDLSARWQIPAVAVQHHHAHIAAVLAECQIDEPVLGLALDGVGLGDDGGAWGGELLRVDGAHFQRLGHLRMIGMPGGDRAAQEPWRMAAAALGLLGRASEIPDRFASETGASVVMQMVGQGVRLPMTSSMGRWFDAAAGLLGVSTRMNYEGQAAMLLEGLAGLNGPVPPERAYAIHRTQGGLELDLSPLIECMADIGDAQRGAALFHAVLIDALAEWVHQAAESTGLKRVACGGGCLMNGILSRGVRQALGERGLRMLEARAVPPGDGGLSLGQAWVARKTL